MSLGIMKYNDVVSTQVAVFIPVSLLYILISIFTPNRYFMNLRAS